MKKRSGFVLILLTLIILFCSCSSESQSVQADFSSPESTIAYFVESVRQNDLDMAVKAFSVEELPQNLNFDSYMREFRETIFENSSYYPSEFTSINKYLVIRNAYDLFRRIIFELNNEDLRSMFSDITKFNNNELIEQYENAFEDMKLSDISIASLEKSQSHDEEYTGKIANAFGAGDAMIFDVVLQLNDKKAGYYMIMLKYGDVWKIENGM